MIHLFIDYLSNILITKSNGNCEIIYYILDKSLLEYLHYYDLLKLAVTNKYLINNEFLLKDIKRKEVFKYFDNTFIPYSILYKSSILKWNNAYMTIDYIDRLHPDYLSNYLMIGIDCWKRPFISIKYKYNNAKYYNGILTIFQRYTSNKDDWRKGNPTGPFLKCCGESGLSENDKIRYLDNVNNIIIGKNIIKINDFSQAYNGDYTWDSNLDNYKEIPIKV